MGGPVIAHVLDEQRVPTLLLLDLVVRQVKDKVATMLPGFGAVLKAADLLAEEDCPTERTVVVVVNPENPKVPCVELRQIGEVGAACKGSPRASLQPSFC